MHLMRKELDSKKMLVKVNGSKRILNKRKEINKTICN